MFVGTHKRNVDDKWRVPLPSDLFAPGFDEDRDQLYFAPAGDHLILFSGSYFRRLTEQLLERSVMAHQDLRRKFFGNTYPKQRDKSGRVQIPEPLRANSGLGTKSEVVIIGAGPYAEIRASDKAPPEPEPAEMVDIMAALEGLGGE
jgi:DNA-binding transcriptional regulator/RsmH inhibitor MraZ